MLLISEPIELLNVDFTAFQLVSEIHQIICRLRLGAVSKIRQAPALLSVMRNQSNITQGCTAAILQD